eukprot:g6341.t1
MSRFLTYARHLGSGIKSDYKARIVWYTHDWREGLNSSFRILAPAAYIFFASAIPALAFGEQIDYATNGALNGVNILAATAMCGILQAVFGGQPLLIVGVAQPVVIVYIFMYEFLEEQDKVNWYLPWAAWSCIWAAFFIAILAITGVCQFIDKFTRFSGELFGMLIAVLFMQQAITGLVDEFKIDKNIDVLDRSLDSFDPSTYHWRLVNGLWSLLLAIGLLSSSLILHGSRSWRFGKGWLRTILADYGVPIMVLLWTGVSYVLRDAPENIPRRLNIPNTWDQDRTWKSAKDLMEIDGWLIAASVVPGVIITVLYYFDHNISSKLAQQKEFDLKKPPAYHYDFLLLALMTLLCGLLGLPPANGAIPQSPMHTKSLASLKRQLVKRDIKKANKSMKNSMSTSDLNRTEENTTNDKSESSIRKSISAQELNEEFKSRYLSTTAPPSSSSDVPITTTQTSVEVKEQRLSNLIQSLLVAVCLGLTPVLQKIPKSVLWGYFGYMAIVNLPGSEFWDRILLLLTDPKRKFKLLESAHPAYLETVPGGITTKFTVLQIALLFVVWGITFAGFFGIFFPIAIMLLVPARQYLMPKIFNPVYLRELDMAEYEEAPAIDHEEAVKTTLPTGIPEEEELREQLEQEIVGTNVKHHLTREEIIERRRQTEQNVQLQNLELQNRGMEGPELPITKDDNSL